MSTELLHSGANERRHKMLDKLGGREVLTVATHTFYDRQIQDQRLLKFFHGTDLTILKWHQFNLMSIAFTAVPDNFDVRHLILKRHAKLFDQGLDESYFDVVMGHFVATLEEMNVDQSVIDEAVQVISPLREIFIEGAQEAKVRKEARKRQDILHSVTVVAGAGIMIYAMFRASMKNRSAA